MTETIETCRKRLLFRSWHRGSREADLLFGTFAERNLDSFDAARLAAYGRLLDEEDPDLWDWVVLRAPFPPEHDAGLVEDLRNFRYRVRSA